MLTVNVVMPNLAFLVVGVVVVEIIFVDPSIGSYLVDHVATATCRWCMR